MVVFCRTTGACLAAPFPVVRAELMMAKAEPSYGATASSGDLKAEPLELLVLTGELLRQFELVGRYKGWSRGEVLCEAVRALVMELEQEGYDGYGRG